MLDFSYGKLPDTVETINKCTSMVELQKQVSEGKLPKLCEYQKQLQFNNQPQLATVVHFQTEFQRTAEVKLLAWVQFERLGFGNRNAFEVVLPRSVAAKFVTVSILNVEDYLAEKGQQGMGKNVDMKSVTFHGNRISTSILNHEFDQA